MEFILVPLAAIAAAAFVVDKVAALAFHIHLSWRLLILLAGFAWLISMVLPGVFFQSAGLMGSVTLSLLCAAGFAWLAALYDVRTGASQLISDRAVSVAGFESETGEKAPVKNDFTAEPMLIASQGLGMEAELQPIPPPDTQQKIDAGETLETIGNGEQSANRNPAMAALPIHEPDILTSGTLEELLEVAFEQRSLRQDVQALETFRLIKQRFIDTDALPMVVAEIVSTLQSQGNLGEAAEELAEILQLPEIRKQGHLVEIFEQKLRDILVESDIKAD